MSLKIDVLYNYRHTYTMENIFFIINKLNY